MPGFWRSSRLAFTSGCVDVSPAWETTRSLVPVCGDLALGHWPGGTEGLALGSRDGHGHHAGVEVAPRRVGRAPCAGMHR